jgi:hypothetical protein
MSCRTEFCKRFLLICCLLATAAVIMLPQAAFAQVEDKNLIFQLEGDARTAPNPVCFLPFVQTGSKTNGGPATATPVTAGTNNTDSNGCPTIDPTGAAATWSLITFGGNTDDWSSFVFSSGAFTNKAHSLFVPAFTTDAVNAKEDTFLGTGSSDSQDISSWGWNAAHNVQNKDDIEHAYAGAYQLSSADGALASGDTILVAGMDRFGNSKSGDSTAGFWFLQDSTFAECTGIGTDTNGNNSACPGAGVFVGHHFDGDLLVVSDFSTGGNVSTINAFVWQSGTPVLDATRSPAPCDLVNPASHTLCGVVSARYTQGLLRGSPVLNATTEATGGWTYSDVSGNSGFSTGGFLEIALDLNKVFPNGVPCFSIFFAETRSSTSINASLSDIVKPASFPLCSVTATKQCTGSSITGGNTVHYTFTGSVINSGSATLYNPTVYDTLPANSSNLQLTQPAGAIAGGGSGSYSGSFDASAILGSNDKNFISAAASSSSSGTPLNVVCGPNPPTAQKNCADWGDPTTGNCPPPSTPGLTLTKACKACLVGNSDVHVSVSENFKLCNTGNLNISNITVQDCRGGTWTGTPGSQSCSGTTVTIASGQSINAGASCLTFSTSYNPTTAAATYSDQAIASGTLALNQGTIFANGGAAAQASCPVCPINLDCSTNPPVAP